MFLVSFLEIKNLFFSASIALRNWLFRPDGPIIDPFFKVGNDFGTQLPLRRHLEVIIPIPDRFDEQAFLCIPRLDRWTGVPSRKYVLKVVELNSAFKFFRFRRVALVTLFRENGSNLLFEKFVPFGTTLRYAIQRRREKSNVDEFSHF